VLAGLARNGDLEINDKGEYSLTAEGKILCNEINRKVTGDNHER